MNAEFLMKTIMELKDQVSEIHTNQAVQGAENKAAFSEVKSDISELKEDVGSMSDKMDSMSSRLEALETKKSFFGDLRELAIPFVKSVAGSKIVIVGSSILLMALAFHCLDKAGIDVAKIPSVVIQRPLESDDQLAQDSVDD